MNTATLQEEARFADSEYSSHFNSLLVTDRMFARYSRPRQRWDWRQFSAELLGNVRDRCLLDYGCGMGEEAVCFARLGANVTAIDVSNVGIQITRDRAKQYQVANRVKAYVMDATATNFSDKSYDLVHGLGILHHVGLQEGLSEVSRLLKPGGSGVFLEPLGNIRFIERLKSRLHRRLVNRLDLIRVNEQEENLRLNDIRDCANLFSSIQIYPYRLLSRIRKLIAPRRCDPLLARLDYWILKVAPFLHTFAGAAVIHVRK